MDRNVLIGMTTGAVFMFGFGVVWLHLGLFRGRPSPAWLRVSLLIIAIALGGSIAILSARASRIPRDATPLSDQQIATNRQIALHFYVIFGIELAAIFLAAAVLSAIHYPDYILSGIALIVGVHFFPLAALFKAPLYYGTALVGCAIGLIGFFVEDAGLRQKNSGIIVRLTAMGDRSLDYLDVPLLRDSIRKHPERAGNQFGDTPCYSAAACSRRRP